MDSKTDGAPDRSVETVARQGVGPLRARE